MALTQVPPALLTSTTGTGSTVVLSASPTFTGTVTTPSVTFSDASTQTAAASPYVLKNRIINGAMVIDQRNAGASVTPTTGAVVYTLDRWFFEVSQSSKFTTQQDAGAVTPPVGFNDYLGVTSSSAYSVLSTDYFLLIQKIEGYNIADLAWGTANAKTVTLSFWVRSSLTGTFGGSLSNNAGNRVYPFSYTISTANTWEYKTVTIAGDTSGTWLTTNGAGMQVVLGLGVGTTYSGTAGAWTASTILSVTGATSVVGTSGATWYVTGVQLEVGSTATPFERRLYNQELANCQRYYYSHAKGDAKVYATAAYFSSSYITSYVQFAVTMRTTPSLIVATGTDYYMMYRNSSTDGLTTLGYGGGSPQGGELYNSTEASGTAGQAGFILTNNGSSSIAFSAEL